MHCRRSSVSTEISAQPTLTKLRRLYHIPLHKFPQKFGIFPQKFGIFPVGGGSHFEFIFKCSVEGCKIGKVACYFTLVLKSVP
jgi:hypothetical protein